MQQAPSVQKAPTKTVVVAGGVVVDRHIFQGRPTSPTCNKAGYRNPAGGSP